MTPLPRLRFDAVHESGNGTSRRNQRLHFTSGFGVRQTRSIDGNDANDP
jgi:hypothetical protein